jgi:Leucine-rich repeat (LRR) protein
MQMKTILALALCLMGSSLLGSDTPAEMEIARWVQQLGDDTFAQRKLAMQQLMLAGDAAIPALVQAVAQQDYETQRRSLLVLEDFASQRGATVEAQIVEQLTAVQVNVSDDTSRLIQQSLLSIATRRTSLAVQELQNLGAELREGEAASAIVFGRNWKGSVDKVGLAKHLNKVVWLSIEHSTLGDSCLQPIAEIKGLKKLYLGDSHVHGKGLEQLAQLTQLDYLSLKNLQLENEALVHLAQLKNLQSLGLDGSTVDDNALTYLADLQELKTLWLDNTAISEQGIQHLAQLKNLTSLHLAYTRVSGKGLAALRDCPQLSLLSLKGVQLAAEDLEHISGLSHLQSLGLDHTNLTDAHLEHLKDLPALRVLWLTKTKVTDDCVESLVTFPALETLYLHASDVSEHGVAKLKKLLPNCKVYR